MANVSTQQTDFVDVPVFICLGPARWWQFKDTTTGKPVKVESSGAVPGRVEVRAKLGDKSTQQVLRSDQVNIGGIEHEQYTWLQSIADGLTLTWDGLVIPQPWKVGQSVSALAKEASPVTGNKVRMTLTLKRLGKFTPPNFPPSARDAWRIEIEQVIMDTGLGSVMVKGDFYFAMGLGVDAVNANVGGVFSHLVFDTWSGAN